VKIDLEKHFCSLIQTFLKHYLQTGILKDEVEGLFQEYIFKTKTPVNYLNFGFFFCSVNTAFVFS
jgi:hypothetical protein